MDGKLVERLSNGEHILCAEGFLFALSRKGYLNRGSGDWIPYFLLEHPNVLRTLHYEFVQMLLKLSR